MSRQLKSWEVSALALLLTMGLWACVMVQLVHGQVPQAPRAAQAPPVVTVDTDKTVKTNGNLTCHKPGCNTRFCECEDDCHCHGSNHRCSSACGCGKLKEATHCGCSNQCTCGCQEGEPCTCGEVSKPVKQVVQPVQPTYYYQPQPTYYQPTYQSNYQSNYQSRPMMNFSGGSRRGGSC